MIRDHIQGLKTEFNISVEIKHFSYLALFTNEQLELLRARPEVAMIDVNAPVVLAYS